MALSSENYFEKGYAIYEKYYNEIENTPNPSQQLVETVLRIESLFSKVNFSKLSNVNQAKYRFDRAVCCAMLSLYFLKKSDVFAKKYIEIGLRMLDGLEELLTSLTYLTDDDIDKVKGSIKTKTRVFHYSLANIYFRSNDYENAIDNYDKAALLGHIPSLYLLGAIFGDENSPIYDQNISNEYFIKAANTKIDNLGDIQLAKFYHSLSCSNAGRIYFDKKEYSNSLIMFEEALKYSNLFEREKESICNYLNGRIESINKILQNNYTISSKHKAVLSMFDEESLSHFTEDTFAFIETALLTKEYLDSLGDVKLDYSSAIIPLLKCVEDICFNLFGDKYLQYLRSLDNLDFRLIPDNFYRRNRNTHLNELRNSIDRMELGKIIYAICPNYYGSNDNREVSQYVISYLSNLGIIVDNNVCLDFVRKLTEIKDRYRNVAAHRIIVDKNLATNCFQYLLEETVKFINNFFKNFY